MEVSGIEGNFRNTCENTMRVLRENKDSLLAILEAFVYDPLLSFRLLNLKTLINQKDGQKNVLAAPEVGTSIMGESSLISREKTA
jgi:FKBP12-rapamycin complex-associated protein